MNKSAHLTNRILGLLEDSSGTIHNIVYHGLTHNVWSKPRKSLAQAKKHVESEVEKHPDMFRGQHKGMSVTVAPHNHETGANIVAVTHHYNPHEKTWSTHDRYRGVEVKGASKGRGYQYATKTGKEWNGKLSDIRDSAR